MIEEPSDVEKLSGSLATGMLTTVAAAVVGGPIAAMLPVLTGSFAVSRRKDRVNRALSNLQTMFEENAEKIQRLSDSQFRVVSEIVEATIATAQEKKLEYLKRAAKSVIEGTEITPHESEWLARVLRDLSADEMSFVIENQEFKHVQFAHDDAGDPEVRTILDDDPALPAASGLISLGLLIPGLKGTYKEIGTYRFNPLIARLLALVEDDV